MNGTRLLAAVSVLVFGGASAPPALAQYCSDTIGDPIFIDAIPGGMLPSEEKCQGAFYCKKPEVGAPEPEKIFDPESGTYTVRMKVPLTVEGNSQNDGTNGTTMDFRARIHWFDSAGPPVEDCFPGFNDCVPVESCGGPGATIDFDVGWTTIQVSGVSCQNLADHGTYSFSVYRCATPAGTCTTRTDSESIPLTQAALSEVLGCGEPKSTCATQACQSCPAGCSGGSAGGGPGSFCPRPMAAGPNASLFYTAGGAGSAGLRGSTEWSPVLGRGWSHDYAERLMLDPDESHVWLITRFGTYVEFWNRQGGLYQSVSPSNEYRKLHRTAAGWELQDLDGTVQSFDEPGRWSGTVDRNGNARIPTYVGVGRLEEVNLPDGRLERFAYHPDGKLASIEEVGIDGTMSRAWSYTWTGDDLTRIDQPGGTALEFFYNDARHPGYLTRAELVGTGGVPPRVEQGWQYDDDGNVVRTWKGETATAPEGDAPGPGAVDVWGYGFDDPELPTETQVTDPLENLSTYTVDRDPASDTPRVLSISGDCPTCGLGPNTQFFYDDPVNPLQPTRTLDGRGVTTLTVYDGNGQMTSRSETLGSPLERTTTWEYSDPRFPAFPTAIEQPSSSGSGVRRTVIVYDATGNAEHRTITGVEAGSSFSYETVTQSNPAGQPDWIDPPGYGTDDRASFTHDPARGNLLPLTRTDPLVGTTGFAYDPLNRRTHVTDPNGVVTETVYDDLDRVRFVIQKGTVPAEDLVTEQIYNGYGDLFRTILPRGNLIEYDYDGAGRLTSIERKPNPATRGERTFYELDPAGNRTREDLQRPEGPGWVTESFTEYIYTSRCQLDKILHPDGTVTEYAYDCNGNLERVWDAKHASNNQTAPATQSYAYDELDRLVTLSQPWIGEAGGEAVTRYAYDVQDHLTQVTDAEGNVTRYVYSDRDLLTEEVSEVSGTSTFRYNEHGELAEETDAREITVTRLIDPLDRVLFVDYPDNSLDVSYTYDDSAVAFSKGRLTAITRAGQSVGYRYDRFGRVTQDGALVYAYDGNGNRIEIGYPGGVTATYTHDYADRQETLTLEDGGNPSQPVVTGAAYKPSGPLTILTLGNGLTVTRDYDQRYFPQRIHVAGLLDWTYTADAVGNILSITDAVDPAGSRTYGYQDVHYFLSRGDGPWGELSWTYDKIGNRLSETRDGEADVYQYLGNTAGGHNPKLTEINPGTEDSIRYFYDAAGNQTYRSEGATKQRLSYDAASRLSQILTDSPESTGAITQLRYDGRSFLDTATLAPFPGRPEQLTTSATYSSEGLLHHRATEEPRGPASPRNAPDRVTVSFVLYFAGRPVEIYDKLEETALGGEVSETTSLTYLTSDHLGTPVLATNADGNSAWAGGFEPFGADYSEAQQAGVFLRFPGQWENNVWEAASGGEALYYNVHRWYEYQNGRYSRVDPLPAALLIGVQHSYSYSGANPVVRVDPLGLAVVLGPAMARVRVPGVVHFGFGGRGNVAFFGAAANSGMAFDTTGNVCFYFRRCFLVGWNTVVGGALGANASVGTGFLCSGKTISHGGYFFVALGGAIQGQVRYSEEGGIKAGRGFGGVGAGAGLGYIGCETTYECFFDDPCKCQ